jgi:alkylation response protein AidB-like acyl-CoA dehydrogenase
MTAVELRDEVDGLGEEGVNAAVLAAISAEAVRRDRDGELSPSDIDFLRESGVFSPPSAGDWSSAVQRVRAVAGTDAAIAQIVAEHLSAHALLAGHRVDGAGQWLARASVTGTARETSGTFHVASSEANAGFVLRGVAALSPGGANADAFVLDGISLPDGREAVVVVPRHLTGVSALSLGPTFGQRSARNGELRLNDVVISHDLVERGAGGSGQFDGGWRSYDEALQTGIDVGVLERFMGAAREFLLNHARAWHESGTDVASQDPHTIATFGNAYAQLEAASCLLKAATASLGSDCVVRGDNVVRRDNVVRGDNRPVVIARSYAYRRGGPLISSVIGTLGASSTSGAVGLDRYWRDFRTHALRRPPYWELDDGRSAHPSYGSKASAW